MDNAKNPRVLSRPYERGSAKGNLSAFQIGIWARDEIGVLRHITVEVSAENSWSAVGQTILHLRATDPRISIRPDGISVICISGERPVRPNDGKIIQ